VIWRFFSFVLLALVGAMAGFYAERFQLGLSLHALMSTGALVALCLWWLIDALRGLRVIQWLREGDIQQAPSMMGLWGQLVDRIRRLLREQQKALQASDKRLLDFLQAIQASPNGVILLDAHDQIEWCNQTAAVQLGIDPSRDLDQRIGNLVRDPLFADYMHKRKVVGEVVLSGRGDSPTHPVRISLQRHPYGDGKQLLLTRDVTALEQAEAMRRDFVANVSHEIRTPLTVMSGFVETMLHIPLDEADRARYLNLMSTQAHRMQSLVEDLLTLSRLEGSPTPKYHDHVAIGQVLRVCLDEGLALSKVLYAGQSPQTIQLEMDEFFEDACLVGDVKEIHSALSNLVSNAIRYTGAGGAITLGVKLLADDKLCLSVSDTGLGIAPEHIPRLTERFYRVDQSRSRESGGTGLGLAIVKHIAQRHGGTLHIKSQLGAGSTFALIFPLERWRMQ
jgi:two-component system phosphate regulon sensor histidine kinase PhoR